MNKNAIFFANTQSLQSLNLTNENQVSYSSASNLISFLSDRINSLQNILIQQIFFAMPNNCTQDDCSWICWNYLTSTGLNFEQILNGTVISTEFLNQNLTLGAIGARILQNSPINDNLTINFNDSFTLNTYTKANSTNLNFTIDGGAGIILFEDTNNVNVYNSNFLGKSYFGIMFWLSCHILIILS